MVNSLPKKKEQATEEELEEPEQAPEEQEQVQVTEKQVNAKFRMDAYILYEVVRAIDSVVNYGLEKGDIAEVHLKVSKDGLNASMMDKAKVAMIKLNLSTMAFDSLDVKSEGELCFNAKDVLSILKNVKRETQNQDGTIKSEGEKLDFSTEGAKSTFELEHSDYTRTFTLDQLEPERSMSDVTISGMKNVSNFAIHTKDLERILHDIAVVEGNYVRLIIGEDKVRVESGHDTTPATKSFGADLIGVTPEKGSIALIASYDLGFLTSFVSNLPKEADLLKFSITRIGESENIGPVIVNVNAYNEFSVMLAPRYEIE